MYKVTENIPPEYPTWERLERLKQMGFKTDGSITELEKIIKGNGFKCPGEHEGYYGFILNHKYTRLYLTYVDACAELILMLFGFGMIKSFKV